LNQEPEICVYSFEQNNGRAAARNFLAAQAKGERLLFIDADSLPISENFIAYYIDQLEPNTILCGGTHYSGIYRTEQTHLHWKYGSYREVSSSIDKEDEGFKSNNFCLFRSVFMTILFNEALKQYGHEDTLFGIVAKKQGVIITSIDNQVIHTGLETNAEFLNKTEQSIQSLGTIIQSHLLTSEELLANFKLIAVYTKLKKYRLIFLIKLLLPALPLTKKILLEFSGPLFLFDIYKLLLFHKQSILIQSSHK
jgi:glycosyltransferase involved in cell wall biosynthesis